MNFIKDETKIAYIKSLSRIYNSYYHKEITEEYKDELIKLDYKGIDVGDLIYDTYLRYKPAPTVDIKDKYLFKILISTLFIIDNTKKYFKKKIKST